MAPVKAEELVAFVPKEQYDGVDYCITSPPPWLTAVLLAFQHYLVMLGTTVIVATILVPLMGGGHVEKAIVVQTILFLAGINTLLQVHLGTRLPAVMGASYAYIYPAVAIILSPRFAIVVDPFERFVYTMRSLQGALIIAGVVQAIIGFFGIWRIFIRFLSPLAAVPFVTLSALGLFYFAFPGVAKCIEVGLPALILLLLFTEYAAHFFARGSFLFGRCAVLATVLVVWIYAEILTAAGAYNERSLVTQFSCRADRSGLIHGAPWAYLPFWTGCVTYTWFLHETAAAGLCFLQYCNLNTLRTKFILSISLFLGLSIPQYFREYEVFYVFGPVHTHSPAFFFRELVCDSCEPHPPRMANSRLSTVSSWLPIGMDPIATYLLEIKLAGDRKNARVEYDWFIFNKVVDSNVLRYNDFVDDIAKSYPWGPNETVTIGYMDLVDKTSHHVKTDQDMIVMFEKFIDIKVIPMIIRIHGIDENIDELDHTLDKFNVIVNVIFSSPATVAAILAYLLDCTHTYWDGPVWKDRGFHWWEKFKSYRHDPRSEEFYSLPYGLSKYFPSF
uniref:Uncharacterized protein n=1 Tax=Oryza rufipogon TaxID=4529 RepID=A0A0E0NZW6_ORYRU